MLAGVQAFLDLFSYIFLSLNVVDDRHKGSVQFLYQF